MAGLRISVVEQPTVRLRLFGALDARTLSGDSILPRSKRARAMLAYLALADDDVVPRKRFESLLWSKRFSGQQQTSNRQCVRELKAALAKAAPGLLILTRDTIGIDRKLVWIDGLSPRGDEPASGDPKTLLEPLRGIDPSFDRWIDEARAWLVARRPVPSRPAEMIVPARRKSSRGPMIDVSSFTAFCEDESKTYAAPAVSHEVAALLARFRWISVRHTDGQRQGKPANYTLSGHIQLDGSGGRLSARLADTNRDGAIVWSFTTDVPKGLTPAVVADLARSVVARLDPEILTIEFERIMATPQVSDEAYDLLMRAIPHIYTFRHDSWEIAIDLLDRAIGIDPDFGRAQAFSALCRLTGCAQGWVADVTAEVARIDVLTASAIKNDSNDSLGLALAAHIRVFLHKDFDGGKALYERALAINPHCAFSLGYSSAMFAYKGQTKEARARVKRAEVLMVQPPFFAMIFGFKTIIAFFDRNWREAIAEARRCLEHLPTFTNIRKSMIGAMCMAGDFDHALAEHRVLMALEPQFSWERHVETYPFGRAADRQLLWNALREAQLIATEKVFELS